VSNYIKIPQCTCGKCEGGFGAKVMKFMEEEQARQFLMGISNEIYGTIRNQILMLEPLSSLNKIFNMIQQEENHKQLMTGRDSRFEIAVAFAMKEKRLVPKKDHANIVAVMATRRQIVFRSLVTHLTREPEEEAMVVKAEGDVEAVEP